MFLILYRCEIISSRKKRQLQLMDTKITEIKNIFLYLFNREFLHKLIIIDSW